MNELTRRILTACLLLPPVLAAIWAGDLWFLALLMLAGLVMIWEWNLLLGSPPLLISLYVAALFGAGVFLFQSFVFQPRSLLVIFLASFGALVLAWLLERTKSRIKKYVKSMAFFGPIYFITPLVLLADLRGDQNLSVLGACALLIFLLMVWASDIGAYFTGRTIGGPLLWPKISAQKTWSGAVGGFLASMLVGYGAGFLIGGSWQLLLWGGLISVATQAGDFLESFIKRRHNLKDISALLPGHGGLLDRVDGLLIAVFVFYLFMLTQGWPESSAASIFLGV